MKKIWFLLISIVIAVSFISGCQEQATKVEKNEIENVTVQSDLVKLIHGKIIYNKDTTGKINSVDVEYLFKNIAGRDIDVLVNAEFYDKDGNFLGIRGPKEISLREDWTEQGVSLANVIYYSEKDASKVDHVNLVVTDKFG